MPPNTVPLMEPESRVILTERLRLRTLRVADAPALMHLLTKEEVMRWTSHGVVSSIAQAERWTSERALGDVFNFAIELNGDDSDPIPIIGLAGYFHVPEIGYMIHPDWAGNGYATEAIQALIPEIFDRIPPLSEGGTGFDHIEGWADISNKASHRILKKCGFTLCEIIPDPENLLRGPSEIAIFRKARPGKSLEELGLIPQPLDHAEGPPEPPLQ